MNFELIRAWELEAHELAHKRLAQLDHVLKDPLRLALAGWCLSVDKGITQLRRLEYVEDGWKDDGLPSRLWYHDKGSLLVGANWVRNGGLHREGGPAMVRWYYVEGIDIGVDTPVYLDKICFFAYDRAVSRGAPSSICFPDPNRPPSTSYHNSSSRSCSFWECYEESSEEDRRSLLRDWLPSC